MAFEGKCLPTAIGSVPFKVAEEALEIVTSNFGEIPFWPQMPNATFRENMYVQFVERLPGAVIDEKEERVFFNTARDITPELERIYEAYLAGDVEYFALREESASGFYAFVDALAKEPIKARAALKGQITGPVSLGLAVTDENRRPILYNDVLRDAIVKSLSLNLKWQERHMREIVPGVETIIFIDEPYLVSYGSAYISLTREDAIGFLDEIIAAAEGLVGIHCCGNTDWSILMDTRVDIISFDAYDYVQSMALYADRVKGFLKRGGLLAWGIVPSGLPSPDQVTEETASSLAQRLEDSMELLVDKGIDKETLVRQAIITPNCGTASMKPENAKRTFELTRLVSDEMRSKYFPASTHEAL